MLTKRKIKALDRRKDYEKRRNVFRNRTARKEMVEVHKYRPDFTVTGDPVFNVLPNGGKQRVNVIISTKAVEQKVKRGNSRDRLVYLLPKSKKFNNKKNVHKDMEVQKVQSDTNNKDKHADVVPVQ